MHSTLIVLTEKTTAPPLRYCQEGAKQWYQYPLTIYGTPELDINNTMEAQNHAACAIVQQKTGVVS
jgi:hypothetical protein